MKLEELASADPHLRSFFSSVVVTLPAYKKDVANGLPFFTEHELARIEKKHEKTGLTFEEIKRILTKKGMILKPATFKSYLAIGLVPGTSRIKRTGKGNIGYYPERIIRDINLVKYSLYANLSFEDLAKSTFSMNLFAFIEIRNREALSPLIDWETIWDVQKIVEGELDKLFADGQISAEQMELAKQKASAHHDASGKHYDAQGDLERHLEGLQVDGAYVLKELLQVRSSSAARRRRKAPGVTQK